MKITINKSSIITEGVLQQTENKLLNTGSPSKIFTPTNSKELNSSGLKNIFSGQKSSDTYIARMNHHAADQSLGKTNPLHESTDLVTLNTINNLQMAFGDEFNTTYQYFIQANILEYSPYYKKIVPELKQHGMEEYHHAKLLANRIRELGGEVDPNPIRAFQKNSCGYIEPKNSDSYDIVNMAIKGEYCAINSYTKMAEQARSDGDIKTYDLLMKIIEDEYEHVDDLQKLIDIYKLVPKL
jgi:bacterioferritin